MKNAIGSVTAFGLAVLLAAPASAQVTGGKMYVSNTHMDWWGGVARDATARLYDVDANTIELDKKVGLITFHAKKGRLVSLDKLHESIWATRLGDRTGMRLFVLEVTTNGKAELKGNQVVLSVTGSDRQFVLKADPKVQPKKGKKSPYQRLRQMLEDGPQDVTVTGRVEDWEGNFTKFLAKLPGKPRRILVTEFETSK